MLFLIFSLPRFYEGKKNNNNIVICKAHKVSSNAESEAPSRTRNCSTVCFSFSINYFVLYTFV